MFEKLLMKLGCLKGKKVTKPDFWERMLFWGFGDFAKEIPFRFFVFKSCTIMTFKNVVLKLKVKMPSPNQIAGFAGFLNFYVSNANEGMMLTFCMQVHIY